MDLASRYARIGVVVALSQSLSAGAAAPLPSGPQLDLAAARNVVTVAEQYAASKGSPCAVAVVDEAGWPILVERMDGVSATVAPELASGKARTACCSNARRRTLNRLSIQCVLRRSQQDST